MSMANWEEAPEGADTWEGDSYGALRFCKGSQVFSKYTGRWIEKSSLDEWTILEHRPKDVKKWTHTSYAGRCKIVCEHKGVLLIEQENGDVWSSDKSAVKPIETITKAQAEKLTGCYIEG